MFVDKQMCPVSDGQVTVGDRQPGEEVGSTRDLETGREDSKPVVPSQGRLGL